MVKKRRGLSDMLRDETQRLDPPAEVTDAATHSDQQSLQGTESQGMGSSGDGRSGWAESPSHIEPDLQSDKETELKSHVKPESLNLTATDSVSPKVTDLGDARDADRTQSIPEDQSYRVTGSDSLSGTESVDLPIYQRMVRKEARLHEAQYDELTRLARELNRKKRQVGEIITANTLLRVATALLLQRRAELRGDTEDELLTSVSSPRASVPEGKP